MHPDIARARRALDEGRAAEARAALDALDAGTLSREDVVERSLVLARACLATTPRDPGAALLALDHGLGVASTDARLVTVRAVAFLESGRLDDADRSISRAVALAPDSPDAHYMRGVIRERRGSLEKAYRSFTRTITLERAPELRGGEPRGGEKAEPRTNATAAQGGPSVATAPSIGSPSSGSPSSAPFLAARARRASVARRLGRLETARADLEHYLARVARDAREWVALGVVRSELGAHDEALEAFRRGVEIEANDADARFQAVVAAGRKHDLALMARFVDELAKISPDDRRVEWARGLLAAERGALLDASDLLGRAFRRVLVEGESSPEPEAAVLAERLFSVLKRSGKNAEARALFEEALRKGGHARRLLRAYARSFGRPAARGTRIRILVRSRGQGDPPERLARAYEVEAETADEAWDLAFEAERVLGGHGLERGPILEEHRISKEEGPIVAGILAIFSRAPEEEPSEGEAPESQGFEPEKGWSPDEEGQGEGEAGGGGPSEDGGG